MVIELAPQGAFFMAIVSCHIHHLPCAVVSQIFILAENRTYLISKYLTLIIYQSIIN